MAAIISVVIVSIHLVATMQIFHRLTALDVLFTLVVPVLVYLIRLKRHTLWVVAVYLLFLSGYLGKAFYMYGLVGDVERLFNVTLDWMPVTQEQVQQAHLASLAGILVVLLGAAFASRLPFRMPVLTPPALQPSKYMPAVVILSIIALGLSLAQIIFGINIMGVGSDQLPGPLSAFMNRLKLDWIPVLLLFFYWLATPYPRERRLILFCMLLLGLADGAARASRGGALPTFVPVVFLWLFVGRFNSWKIWSVAGVLLLTAVAYPYISNYRLLLLQQYSAPEAVRIIFAEPLAPLEHTPITEPLRRITLRFIGLDSVAMMWDHIPDDYDYGFRVADYFGNRSIVYFTHEVVGVTSKNDFRSPGWFGTFILAFGRIGFLLALFLHTLLIGTVATYLTRLPGAPVLLAAFSSELMFGLSENPFSYLNWISLLIVFTAVVYLTRRYTRVDRGPERAASRYRVLI